MARPIGAARRAGVARGLLIGEFMTGSHYDKAMLEASFLATQKLTSHHAKSFYFASFFLPRHKKDAACAVYAFCRHADDAMDEAAPSTDLAGVLDGLHALLDSLYLGTPPQHLQWAAAFCHTIETFCIPRTYFDELLHGMEMDLRTPLQIQNWVELREYCYYVASVVGLMMSCIFEVRDSAARKHAISLGIAMQLTNILRDVKEDFGRGRVYLPLDELAAHGLDTRSLMESFGGQAWKTYAAFFVARARDFYSDSEKGIPALANDGSQFTVWCMRVIYASILDEIEKAGYDVGYRHRVSLVKKLLLAWRARRLHHATRK